MNNRNRNTNSVRALPLIEDEDKALFAKAHAVKGNAKKSPKTRRHAQLVRAPKFNSRAALEEFDVLKGTENDDDPFGGLLPTDVLMGTFVISDEPMTPAEHLALAEIYFPHTLADRPFGPEKPDLEGPLFAELSMLDCAFFFAVVGPEGLSEFVNIREGGYVTWDCGTFATPEEAIDAIYWLRLA